MVRLLAFIFVVLVFPARNSAQTPQSPAQDSPECTVSDYEKTPEGQTRKQTTRRPPQQITALNEWLKQYAVENKLTYLDYYSAMVDDKGYLKDELSDDGLHPNLEGYNVMRPLIEKAIDTALKKK